VIDVADPAEVLRWLDTVRAELEAHRLELEALRASQAEIVATLNEAVGALNRLIQLAAAAAGDASQAGADPPSQPPAPSLPAAAAATSGGNLRSLLPLLLAKNPALAAKLEALGGCEAHGTFTMGCGACQSAAVAKLAGVS